MGEMDFIIIILLVLAALSSILSFIILIFMRKQIEDIQQSANYIYNNHDKVNYIYRVVKQARKEKAEKNKVT